MAELEQETTVMKNASIHIRVATIEDVPSLFDVRTSVRENHMSIADLASVNITPETIAAMLTGEGRGWVAEDLGRVVAFAMANATEATIFAVFVRPEYEGIGIGRLLMREAEQWLSTRGCGEIWLRTDRNPKVRSNGFYQRLGWKNEGVQEDGQNQYTKRVDNVDQQ
ncbi:Histone acetyltransferase HPA2 [Caballeronia sordidicola]|uniref:Histone acetyltransferase HPA2 n=2 Tax=Caballeronia sordidicola TaxID=196367 RepID=A0A242MCC8_CABSO|nr:MULTISPECIES: GNAT family N-acetyltransferase [Burkholderiaceae]OTP68840.1 Histone acetyltransferase HPA2 [Caballeronia sordidicola]OTP71862.1 Histone acetyltransferase HPA2 [Caballeronia sordidicola]